MSIAFETQEDFEKAVIQVIAELNISLRVGGSPFVTRVSMEIQDSDYNYVISASDFVEGMWE
jgi:hypothetical protein